MQISYDKEADAVAIWFGELKSERTIDVTEDIFVDIDKDGRLAGIEVLNASEKLDIEDLINISVLLFDKNGEKIVLAELKNENQVVKL